MLWVVSTPLRYSFVRWVGILELRDQGGDGLVTLRALAAAGQDSQVLPPEGDDPARLKMRDGVSLVLPRVEGLVRADGQTINQ